MPSKTRAQPATSSEPISLDELFTYHPPDEEQREKYHKLLLAFTAVLEAGKAAMKEAATPDAPAEELAKGFTASCKAYAELINEFCPPSADRTAAIRCLRLARNAVNDVLFGMKQFPHGLSQFPFHVIFETELIRCRYQSNASIALAGRS